MQRCVSLQDNPFGDQHLLDKFTWHKKKQKESAITGLGENELEERERRRQEENKVRTLGYIGRIWGLPGHGFNNFSGFQCCKKLGQIGVVRRNVGSKGMPFLIVEVFTPVEGEKRCAQWCGA